MTISSQSGDDREREMRPRTVVGLILVLHLAAATLLSPGYIIPDSLGTYSWLRSIVFNGDLLLYDEWAGFGLIRDGITLFKEVSPTGALANHWGVGTSLLSAPAYLLAHLWAMQSAGADGVSGIYALALAWTAVLFGAAASIAAFAVLRGEGVRSAHVLLAVLLVLVGTPMLWYEVRFPLGTHMAGVFAVGMLVLALARLGGPPGRGDVMCGLLLGLAIITRIQHVMLFPAVVLHLWRSGRRVKGFALAAAGGALPVALQASVWWAVYGQPLGPLSSGSAPLGGTWMAFGTNALAESLFSSYHGLLTWAPIFALAIAGWAIELRRNRLAGTLLLMFVAQWIANGLFDRYFWGGMAFGPRRFVDLAMPAMIGLAWFLRRTGLAGRALAAVAALWSGLLFLAAAARTLDLAGDVLPAELIGAVRGIPAGELADVLWRGAAISRAPGLFFSGLLIAAMVGVLGWLVTRSERSALNAIAVLLVAGLVAALGAFGPTRARTRSEIARFRIDVAKASVAGPLLDARALFLDELAFRRGRGREDARETERLIEEIDRKLARHRISR